MRLFAIAGILGLCLVAATAYVDCRSTRGNPAPLPQKPHPTEATEGVIVRPDNWQISTGSDSNETRGK